MTPDVWLLLAAVVVLLLAAWVAWTLTRLRRLEARVDRAWTALDTQLTRRAALAAELARDPLTGDRELAENALGRELRALPGEVSGVPAARLAALVEADARMALARRFYNDAVRDTHLLRQRRTPRLMRLHADRPLPRFFDVEDGLDAVPTGAGAPRG